MMTSKRFNELGLKLWTENDQLKVSGMSSIPEGGRSEMRRYIRDHKTEIIGQVINHSDLWRHCSGRIDGFLCGHYTPKQIPGDDPNSGYCSHPAVGSVWIPDLQKCPGKWAINTTRQKHKIQKMTRCLHQQPCEYLRSEPPGRPFCAVFGKPIFDMVCCPLGLWEPASAPIHQWKGAKHG